MKGTVGPCRVLRPDDWIVRVVGVVVCGWRRVGVAVEEGKGG
jgi:hypothetical protein